MNKIVKGIVIILCCVLFTGRLSLADELEMINERLKQLQEKVQALEDLKQEMQVLKE